MFQCPGSERRGFGRGLRYKVCTEPPPPHAAGLIPPLRPVLTPACLGPVLLDLIGMELGPFRDEAGDLLPLVTMGGLLREEVGVVVV